MTEDDSLTLVELRRCVRDLFALAGLPALWRRGDAGHTAETLADAILRTLDAELVYVLVPGPGGGRACARAAGGLRSDPDAMGALLPAIRQGLPGARLEILGAEMGVVLQTIDVPGGDQGTIVVAAARSSFPNEVESALLRVAANQASVALQNALYVAELDRAALAREELLAELAAESRRKDHFLAVLGHELRNPLAAIHAAHMLGPGNRETGRAQEIITHQLATLMRLVDDLLDASRVSTGKLALQKRRLDLRAIIDKARAASEHAALQKGRLVTSVADVPLWVDGDEVRLEQVLVNLVGNAIRYTPPGGRLSIEASRASDGYVVVRVEDDGCGITPELLARIFEPFVQADTSLNRSDGGLGLGLALVKGIVELHGGSVTIASVGPGRGCSVLVRLPLVDGAEQLGPGVPAPEPSRRGANLRVLLVDDNSDMIEMLARWLDAEGHETASANDGDAAVELAGRFSPDVAFVDIGLPTIDGYEVARRLRAQLDARVVLIAMSGYGQAEDRARSRQAGFDDHFVKPVGAERIERVLAEVARSRHETEAAASTAGG